MSGRILLVDDNPLVRLLITTHLTDHVESVIEFDAVDPAFAELNTSTYDLLITDLELPGPRNGYWLLEEARTHHPDLPIIVITGSEPERGSLRAADAILLKPFHPDELLGSVLELLGR